MADDFNFNVLSKGYIRTYPTPKAKAKLNAKKIDDADPEDIEKREPLTTKNAVRLLLQGTLKTEVCRYCLNVTKALYELDQIMHVTSKGMLFKVTVRDMLASFHPIKVPDDPNFPNKVCCKCLDNTIKSYLFAQQCEQAERALRNCFEDIYEKLSKLDPIETQKKRGRRKLNPNYNVLYTEHEKVINYAEPLINLVHTSSEPLLPTNPVTELECLKCCQILSSVEDLLNHEKIHPKTMWYNCRICGRSFSKRYLIKRHLQSHLHSKPNITQSQPFSCSTCGHRFENYKELLQHVEKHKFKSIMEHLLERKMGTLCTVCLDKGKDMVDLDNNICLHGGCPNLSGDQSIHSILSSTLPDQKRYKYQELSIPHEATVVTITKNVENKLREKSVDKFIFSSPIIISKKNYGDCTSNYIFSLPNVEIESKIVVQEMKEVNTETNISVNECGIIHSSMPENVEDNDTAIRNIDVDQTGLYHSGDDRCKLIFSCPENTDNVKNNIKDVDIVGVISKGICNLETFESTVEIEDNGKIVDYKLNNFDNEDNYSENTQKLCKNCWIFNKPSCKTCIKGCNDYKESGISCKLKENLNKCKYCWIFAKVNKCDYCKKLNFTNNELDTIDTGYIETCNKVDKKLSNQEDNLEIIFKSNENMSVSDNTNKDINDTISNNATVFQITKDLTAWDCPICLVINDKTLSKCHCCGAKRLNNNVVNYSFGNKILEFYSHTNSKQLEEKYVSNEKANHNQVVVENNALQEVTVSKPIEPMDFEITIEDRNKNNDQMNINNNSNNTDIKEMSALCLKNNVIDVKISKTSIDSNYIAKQDYSHKNIIEVMQFEEMDVAVSNESACKRSENTLPPKYEFNIGSSKERKIKRGVRKMPRASR